LTRCFDQSTRTPTGRTIVTTTTTTTTDHENVNLP
jgi:hypothetical protein